jgi:hypothetical protein
MGVKRHDTERPERVKTTLCVAFGRRGSSSVTEFSERPIRCPISRNVSAR